MGWALFDGPRLVFAKSGGLPTFRRWIQGQECDETPRRTMSFDRIVFELPNYRSKGSIEDVALTGARGGLAAGAASIFCSADPEWITPQQWKGQVPKEIMVERVKGLLSPGELACVVGKASHAFDAIGIGLKLVSRL